MYMPHRDYAASVISISPNDRYSAVIKPTETYDPSFSVFETLVHKIKMVTAKKFSSSAKIKTSLCERSLPFFLVKSDSHIGLRSGVPNQA